MKLPKKREPMVVFNVRLPISMKKEFVKIINRLGLKQTDFFREQIRELIEKHGDIELTRP